MAVAVCTMCQALRSRAVFGRFFEQPPLVCRPTLHAKHGAGLKHGTHAQFMLYNVANPHESHGHIRSF